jgi:hypothetical protein
MKQQFRRSGYICLENADTGYEDASSFSTVLPPGIATLAAAASNAEALWL